MDTPKYLRPPRNPPIRGNLLSPLPENLSRSRKPRPTTLGHNITWRLRHRRNYFPKYNDLETQKQDRNTVCQNLGTAKQKNNLSLCLNFDTCVTLALVSDTTSETQAGGNKFTKYTNKETKAKRNTCVKIRVRQKEAKATLCRTRILTHVLRLLSFRFNFSPRAPSEPPGFNLSPQARSEAPGINLSPPRLTLSLQPSI